MNERDHPKYVSACKLDPVLDAKLPAKTHSRASIAPLTLTRQDVSTGPKVPIPAAQSVTKATHHSRFPKDGHDEQIVIQVIESPALQILPREANEQRKPGEVRLTCGLEVRPDADYLPRHLQS
jgi:hypothetical protein